MTKEEWQRKYGVDYEFMETISLMLSVFGATITNVYKMNTLDVWRAENDRKNSLQK